MYSLCKVIVSGCMTGTAVSGTSAVSSGNCGGTHKVTSQTLSVIQSHKSDTSDNENLKLLLCTQASACHTVDSAAATPVAPTNIPSNFN